MRALAFAALLALLAVGAAAPAASGTHTCDEAYVDLEQVYVIFDHFGDKFLFSLWIYVESNGVDGLQRGGATLLGDLDICQSSPFGHDTAIV